jgi:acetyl-CoA carboxylase, biotin carboxylase subunit
MHVRIADRAVCIGQAPSKESYLDEERILAAALTFGADAIHPGYGFLSEKASFAELCEQNGMIFVGPTSQVIRLMGDKIEARRFAKRVGVPVTPGSEVALSDPAQAGRIAQTMTFPVLLKAAAGGRGMRIVSRPEDLERMFLEASSEAAAAFGDPSLYVERYLTDVRHVEIQVLGDGEHVIHLGERDCSVQRRNQKLVEECPSPVVDAKLRARMGEAAVRLCSQARHKSAGTIEFLFDRTTGEFYFIEMNTRIQVEHPVTEMVTGADFVKAQLRIASGERLALRQCDLELRGHAIECRINAEEDHQHAFVPCPGRVSRFVSPGGPGVRVDSHIETGYVVPPFYDSLLAKLVCWGQDRQEAIRRMLRALGEIRVEGIKTTVPFHAELLQHQKFQAGEVNTRFVHDVLGY